MRAASWFGGIRYHGYSNCARFCERRGRENARTRFTNETRCRQCGRNVTKIAGGLILYGAISEGAALVTFADVSLVEAPKLRWRGAKEDSKQRTLGMLHQEAYLPSGERRLPITGVAGPNGRGCGDIEFRDSRDEASSGPRSSNSLVNISDSGSKWLRRGPKRWAGGGCPFCANAGRARRCAILSSVARKNYKSQIHRRTTGRPRNVKESAVIFGRTVRPRRARTNYSRSAH